MPSMYDRILPERVEAIQITPENIKRALAWAKGSREVEETNPHDPDGPKLAAINVPTLNGVIRVSQPDFLVLFRGSFESIECTKFLAEHKKVEP